MSDAHRTPVRTILGGFLVGYGVITYILYLWLDSRWKNGAPPTPDPARGFILPHGLRGSTVYFSLFQTTSFAILVASSIPLILLGALIIPKRYILARWRASAGAEPADPPAALLLALAAGMVAAPALIFLLGPVLVPWLNHMGIAF